METRLTGAPGRSWSVSDWPDEVVAVVFDRNSGDFWLVPEITRRILLRLEASGSMPRAELIAGLAADPGLCTDRSEASRVLDDLLDKGLVAVAASRHTTG